ncbi:hypothetical protein NDU88_002681 [Pleurodeles waltl]|uniref:Uncharacterized protein n=1 Tax=Pleurodeles waltl TaxID=8319 RepID=A0AAV7WQW0_PLEWA|nr:hypothetical protein NDU88_002681 [Pleurodeles waltl]
MRLPFPWQHGGGSRRHEPGFPKFQTRAEEQKDAGEQRGEGRAGNSDVPSKITGPVKQNNREETHTHRHVPGGAWLNKVRSLFKGQNKRNTETGDGWEERGDGEGRVERGVAGVTKKDRKYQKRALN